MAARNARVQVRPNVKDQGIMAAYSLPCNSLPCMVILDTQADIKPLCHDIGIQCELSEFELKAIPPTCSTPVKEPPCPNFSFDEAVDDEDEISLYEPPEIKSCDTSM